MADKNVYDRKKYVEQVRRSFMQNNGNATMTPKKSSDEWSQEEEGTTTGSMIKLRFFFSVIIFTAVLLCYQCDYQFYGISVSKIMQKIETPYENTKLTSYLQEAFSTLSAENTK
jgi:hypothetical protein